MVMTYQGRCTLGLFALMFPSARASRLPLPRPRATPASSRGYGSTCLRWRTPSTGKRWRTRREPSRRIGLSAQLACFLPVKRVSECVSFLGGRFIHLDVLSA